MQLHIVRTTVFPKTTMMIGVIGVGDHGPTYQRFDDVVQRPGVDRRFDDDGIGELEVLLRPLRETTDIDSMQGQDDLHLGVETAHDDVVLVGIDGDVAFDDLLKGGT
jgi:hypothetical protein